MWKIQPSEARLEQWMLNKQQVTHAAHLCGPWQKVDDVTSLISLLIRWACVKRFQNCYLTLSVCTRSRSPSRRRQPAYRLAVFSRQCCCGTYCSKEISRSDKRLTKATEGPMYNVRCISIFRWSFCCFRMLHQVIWASVVTITAR